MRRLHEQKIKTEAPSDANYSVRSSKHLRRNDRFWNRLSLFLSLPRRGPFKCIHFVTRSNKKRIKDFGGQTTRLRTVGERINTFLRNAERAKRPPYCIRKHESRAIIRYSPDRHRVQVCLMRSDLKTKGWIRARSQEWRCLFSIKAAVTAPPVAPNKTVGKVNQEVCAF